MGVAVLNPRDCLQNPLAPRQGLLSPPPRVRNPKPSRPNRAQRKRASPPRAAAPVSPQAAAKGLVMGKVKILKRGEEMPKSSPENPDLVPDLGSTNRLGPDPQLVPTQIRLKEPNKAPAAAFGFYAGSAFVASPPPSSLPLPAFFMKKTAGIEDATSGLRRILGLNL